MVEQFMRFIGVSANMLKCLDEGFSDSVCSETNCVATKRKLRTSCGKDFARRFTVQWMGESGKMLVAY